MRSIKSSATTPAATSFSSLPAAVGQSIERSVQEGEKATDIVVRRIDGQPAGGDPLRAQAIHDLQHQRGFTEPGRRLDQHHRLASGAENPFLQLLAGNLRSRQGWRRGLGQQQMIADARDVVRTSFRQSYVHLWPLLS
jgi:hypothetical protein